MSLWQESRDDLTESQKMQKMQKMQEATTSEPEARLLWQNQAARSRCGGCKGSTGCQKLLLRSTVYGMVL